MNNLNKIFTETDKLRNKCLKLFPDNKKELNEFFNSLLQTIEAMNYVNQKGNTSRYWFTKEDIPIESVMTILNKVFLRLKKIDKEEIISFFAEIEAKLHQIEGEIKSARKGINKLLIKI